MFYQQGIQQSRKKVSFCRVYIIEEKTGKNRETSKCVLRQEVVCATENVMEKKVVVRGAI